MPQQKIGRNILTLGWVSLLTDISSEMIYPLLPVFLSNVLGTGTAFIGIIEGFAESSASIVKIFSGWFSDKIQRRKPIILAGYSLSTAVKPLLYFAGSAWQVLFVRVVDRIGKGLRVSPRDALVAASCPSDQRGRAFGIQRAMDSLGAFLGPLAAFGLLSIYRNNYRLVFLIAVFPALLAVLVIILFLTEKTSSSPIALKKQGLAFGLSFKNFSKEFKFFIIVVALFTLGNSSNAFLILRARGLGLSLTLIPIAWMVYNLVSSVSAVPFGRLSDRLGRKKIILLGFLLYSAVYFGFALAKLQYQAWILFAAYGIYSGISEGVLRAYVADIVPDPSRRATAYGFFNTAEGLFLLPASFLMGGLWQIFGPVPAFSFGALLSLGAACLFALYQA